MVIYPSDTKAVLLADIVPILKKYGVTLQAESKAKIEDLVPRYATEKPDTFWNERNQKCRCWCS